MKVSITRREVTNLFGVIVALLDKAFPVKFKYALAKTFHLLQPEVKAIEKALQPPKELAEYYNELRALAPDDENGRAAIAAKYKKAIDDNNEKQAAREAFLDERISVEVHAIRKEDIPDEITVKQTIWLTAMIEDTDQEGKKAVHK